jgi:hypothetical protein
MVYMAKEHHRTVADRKVVILSLLLAGRQQGLKKAQVGHLADIRAETVDVRPKQCKPNRSTQST